MNLKNLVFVFVIFLAGCASEPVEKHVNVSKPEKAKPEVEKAAESKPAEKAEKSEESTAVLPSKQECLDVDTGDNAVLASQTFPVDLAPLGVGCLVTEHNPEFDDPPMESQLGFYKDGKLKFRFPEMFNGATSGCWIEAVAFDDLNDDDLKDVVVIGKCSAKEAPYFENMIYVNDGKTFKTNADANQKLSELTTVQAVKDLARKNKELFF